MKNREILVRSIAEASGRTVNEIRLLMDFVIQIIPQGHRLNDEVPEAEALRLLAAFRDQKQDIQDWLWAGYCDAIVERSLPPVRKM